MSDNAESMNSASRSNLIGYTSGTAKGTGDDQPPGERPRSLEELSKEAGYELIEKIGQGTYGDVWKARDKTSVDVAIKFLTRGTREQKKELLEEANKLSLLNSVNGIVHLRVIKPETIPPYIIMEYASGGSLESHLKGRLGSAGSQPPASASAGSGTDTSDYKGSKKPYGTMPVAEALELFEQIVNSLAVVHNKGIIHCDLKPANVLLDEDNKPILADFGQSSLPNDSKPRLGTFFYMAPEQADIERAQVDTRYDVYALGAIFYVMVTGRPPRHDSALLDELNKTQLLGHRLVRYREFLRNAPAPMGHRKLPGMDSSLADLISACLRVDPKRRPASASVIQSELKRRRQRIKQRPLMLFAIFGPLVLMVLMYILLRYKSEKLAEESLHNIRTVIEEQVRAPNRSMAKEAARGIAERIEKTYSYFKVFANDPKLLQNLAEIHTLRAGHSLTSMSPPEGCSKLKGILIEHPKPLEALRELLIHFDKVQDKTYKFYSFGILSPEGIGLTNYNGKTKGEAPRTVFVNFSWRDYFNGKGDQSRIRGQTDWVPGLRKPHLSQPFITTPEFDSDAKQPFVSMTHPIMVNGNLVGYLQASIYMDVFAKWFTEMKMPAQRIAIYNGKGHCLFHHPDQIQNAFFETSAKKMYAASRLVSTPGNNTLQEDNPSQGINSLQDDNLYVDPVDNKKYWAAFFPCDLPASSKVLMESESGNLTVIAEIDPEETLKGFDVFRETFQAFSRWVLGFISFLLFLGILLYVLFGWLLWYLKRKERLIRG